VVQHARHTLAALEAQQLDQQSQVDLFAPPPPSQAPELPAALAALQAIDPDALSPREALDQLYALKKLVSS
jgi:DNA mismatch repair protein MutS